MQSSKEHPHPTHPGVPRQDSNTLPSYDDLHRQSIPRTTSVPTAKTGDHDPQGSTSSDPSTGNYDFTADPRFYAEVKPNHNPQASAMAAPGIAAPSDAMPPPLEADLPRQRASGPAPGTAGPHHSDSLNKIDPRVDSDGDGSATLGGRDKGAISERDDQKKI